jgi:hypothetical protein
VVEVKLFKVSEAFSSKELLNKKLSSGWDVYEPKVIVFGPQENCFGRIIIDSSCVSEMPIKDLFLGSTRY